MKKKTTINSTKRNGDKSDKYSSSTVGVTALSSFNPTTKTKNQTQHGGLQIDYDTDHVGLVNIS